MRCVYIGQHTARGWAGAGGEGRRWTRQRGPGAPDIFGEEGWTVEWLGLGMYSGDGEGGRILSFGGETRPEDRQGPKKEQ